MANKCPACEAEAISLFKHVKTPEGKQYFKKVGVYCPTCTALSIDEPLELPVKPEAPESVEDLIETEIKKKTKAKADKPKRKKKAKKKQDKPKDEIDEPIADDSLPPNEYQPSETSRFDDNF
jgi:hypothetical protein